MAVKKTPMRMCLACREMRPKKDLMRVVKSPDGSIFIDDTFKANGRGAYLCNSAACVDKCVRQKMLNKQFGCAVDEEVYSSLKNKVNESEN